MGTGSIDGRPRCEHSQLRVHQQQVQHGSHLAYSLIVRSYLLEAEQIEQCPGSRLSRPIIASASSRSAATGRKSTSPLSWPDSASASRRLTKEFGSSASSTMIWAISTWSREPCNPSTTRLGPGCHLCLRYVLLPMCPGQTQDFIGDPGRTRTCDPLLRRQMLYPAELRDLAFDFRLSSTLRPGANRSKPEQPLKFGRGSEDHDVATPVISADRPPQPPAAVQHFVRP